MSQILANVVQALRTAASSSSTDDLPATLRTPDLSPWELWTLFCLVRHHERQQWVATIVHLRLSGDPQLLSDAGAFGHPEIPQKGIVPGEPDWEYFFHGRGCCLTQRATGEAIDVDFYDATGDWFDNYFYLRYLESLRSPRFAEERLIALHPLRESVLLDFETLMALGLLEKHPDRKVFRLAFNPADLLTLLEQLEERWDDAGCREIAAVTLGDPLLTRTDEDELQVMPDCWQARERRLVRLFDESPGSTTERLALLGLADLESPALEDCLRRALEWSPSGTTSAAMEFIRNTNDDAWCEAVYRLLERIDPNGTIPEPHLWKECCQFLLEHAYQTEQVLQGFQRVESHQVAELAVLALEHAPHQAIPLFRRALRSSIIHNRIVAAAVLAILDRPWCHNELMAILSASNQQTPTAECRAALMLSHSARMHELVYAWERRNPYGPSGEPYPTFEELALRECEPRLQFEMQEWHDRILPLRTVEPPIPMEE